MQPCNIQELNGQPPCNNCRAHQLNGHANTICNPYAGDAAPARLEGSNKAHPQGPAYSSGKQSMPFNSSGFQQGMPFNPSGFQQSMPPDPTGLNSAFAMGLLLQEALGISSLAELQSLLQGRSGGAETGAQSLAIREAEIRAERAERDKAEMAEEFRLMKQAVKNVSLLHQQKFQQASREEWLRLVQQEALKRFQAEQAGVGQNFWQASREEQLRRVHQEALKRIRQEEEGAGQPIVYNEPRQGGKRRGKNPFLRVRGNKKQTVSQSGHNTQLQGPTNMGNYLVETPHQGRQTTSLAARGHGGSSSRGGRSPRGGRGGLQQGGRINGPQDVRLETDHSDHAQVAEQLMRDSRWQQQQQLHGNTHMLPNSQLQYDAGQQDNGHHEENDENMPDAQPEPMHEGERPDDNLATSNGNTEQHVASSAQEQVDGQVVDPPSANVHEQPPADDNQQPPQYQEQHETNEQLCRARAENQARDRLDEFDGESLPELFAEDEL